MIVGKAKLDFLDSRYKTAQKKKKFNFSKFIQGISSNTNESTERKHNLSNLNFYRITSDDSPSTDGPIVRNPNRTFEFNRTKENYINPIRVDKSLNQAIEDYNKQNQDQD